MPRVGSREEWVAWRDAEIRYVLEPSLDADGVAYLPRERVIQRCAEASRYLSSNLHEELPELKHFREFVSAQAIYGKRDVAGERTSRLGYEIADKDYWRENSALFSFPPSLSDSKFLSLISRPESVEAAAVGLSASHPDWMVVRYRSQFILSADSVTYGRLLVFIPGDEVDRWIQFAVPLEEDRGKPAPRSVSMVVVRRGASGSEVRLMDFMRSADGSFRPNTTLADSPSNGCYDCHKVGVIPIIPKSSSVPVSLNARIAAYGRCDFGPLPVSSYGPSLGSVVGGDRVSAAMNCGSCHDRIGAINYLAAVRSSRDIGAFESKKGLVQSFVEQGVMPPGNDLSSAERKELYRRLSVGYLDLDRGEGKLVDWLRRG